MRTSHAPHACAITLRFVIGAGSSVADADQADILQLPGRELNASHSKLAGAHAVAEKSLAWCVHAVTAWPNTPFIGKTDDDTLIGLPVHLRDLDALRRENTPTAFTLRVASEEGTVNRARPACDGTVNTLAGGTLRAGPRGEFETENLRMTDPSDACPNPELA